MARMTSSVKAAGCGLVKRTRSRPVDLAAGAQQLAEGEPVAELDAVGVDVLAEQRHLDDALRDERLDLGEDLAGAAVLLLAAQARHDAERARVVAADGDRDPARCRRSRDGSAGSTGRPRGSRGSRPRRACCGAARSSRAGREPMLWVPKTTSTHGARWTMVPRSFWAMQPPTAICMLGVLLLRRAQLAEVAVELVVGVLAHRARVEHDDVGDLGPLPRRQAGEVDVAGRLEQAGEALAVVDVHLAAVRAHVVGPGVRRPADGRGRDGRRGAKFCVVMAPTRVRRARAPPPDGTGRVSARETGNRRVGVGPLTPVLDSSTTSLHHSC